MYRALAEAGLTVPGDFSIAGVAAQHWAENLHPPLTAADVPADEMGARAVELLIQRIADPATPHRHLLVAPPISLRGTTGPGQGGPLNQTRRIRGRRPGCASPAARLKGGRRGLRVRSGPLPSGRRTAFQGVADERITRGSSAGWRRRCRSRSAPWCRWRCALPSTSRHLSAPTRGDGAVGVERHCWLFWPLQSQMMTAVPSAVPLLFDVQALVAVDLQLTGAVEVHRWLAAVAVPDDQLGAVGRMLPVTSRHRPEPAPGRGRGRGGGGRGRGIGLGVPPLTRYTTVPCAGHAGRDGAGGGGGGVRSRRRAA